MSDVINDILERINIFHMCSYKFFVFGAKTLEIIFICDYQDMDCCYRWYQ